PGTAPHLTTPATILRSRRPETERETSEGAGLGGQLLRAAVRWSARALRSLDRPPDSFGRRRPLEVLDAEIGRRVADRVHHRAERGRRAPLTAAAQTEGLGRRRNLADLCR